MIVPGEVMTKDELVRRLEYQAMCGLKINYKFPYYPPVAVMGKSRAVDHHHETGHISEEYGVLWVEYNGKIDAFSRRIYNLTIADVEFCPKCDMVVGVQYSMYEVREKF